MNRLRMKSPWSSQPRASQLCGPLSEVVSGLIPRQREVIQVRFLDGLEYPETAQRLAQQRLAAARSN